jgi:hypothetical protein
MRTNLNVILAAMGATSLLASPAMAKTHRLQTPSAEDVSGAQGAATSHRDYQSRNYRPANEGGPYTPSIPTPAHGQGHDFQDDERGS